MRERILEVARRRFFRLGFSRVRMDEIASDLGMSKKTLYRFFPGKMQLFEAALLEKVESISSGMERIVTLSEGPCTERLRSLVDFLSGAMPLVGESFLEDIRRHAGHIWERLDRRRQSAIASCFGSIFRQGMEQGVLRRDLDPELLVVILSTLIRGILNPEALSQLPLSNRQALDAIMTVLFEGTLSEEGRLEYLAGPQTEAAP